MVNELGARLDAARNAAVARAKSDIELYVLSLKSSQESSDKSASMTVHVHPHATVGAIQTGARSMAQVSQNIDTDSKTRLLDGLARVEESLARIESFSPQAKGDVIEIISDARTELSKERPNAIKLGGQLGAISTAIGAVADMKPAYDNLKMVVAGCLGILFP